MEILGIGVSELIFILIIALLVFGPRRLPALMRDFGKFVRDLRNLSDELGSEWKRELGSVIEPEEIEAAKKELEQMAQLTQHSLKKDIEGLMSEDEVKAKPSPGPAPDSEPAAVEDGARDNADKQSEEETA